MNTLIRLLYPFHIRNIWLLTFLYRYDPMFERLILIFSHKIEKMRKSAACKTSKQQRIIERLAAKNDNNARTAHIIPTCFLCRFCDYCRFFVRCCLKKHLNLLAVVVVFVGCCFGLKFYILVWWDCALYLALSLACHASVGIFIAGGVYPFTRIVHR